MNEPAKPRILVYLLEADSPKAVHEIHIYGVSENGMASRLPELAKQGLVRGEKRYDKPFKEWSLTSDGKNLARELKRRKRL